MTQLSINIPHMKIIIIGNGISGITAARYIRKLSDHEITVISSESAHHYSRPALMYMYMGHMRYVDTKPYEDHFWTKNRISLLQDHVTEIDYQQKTLSTKGLNAPMPYDKLIIAVGSMPNKFGWPGQDLKGVGGFYSLQDLEQIEAYSKGLKRAVVVGGGLIGIELAEMYHSRHIPVTMIVRESSYWENVLPAEESAMITRHIQSRGIDLRLGVNLGEIIDDGSGTACAVTVKETGERIDCGYVGLTAGVRPNVDWLKSSDLHIEKGIVVNHHLETSIPDVYAIGDCAQITEPVSGRRAIEAVWYTGRMMGQTVAKNICGVTTAYDPGIWFNSAKFIDIEYQVYGDVPTNPVDGISSIYWEHPDGEQSVRILYRSDTQVVTGFNLMGIRFRHEVCEKWLRDQATIEAVMSRLELAHFDPEFYQRHYEDIMAVYRQQTGSSITAKPSRGLNRVLQFLKA